MGRCDSPAAPSTRDRPSCCRRQGRRELLPAQVSVDHLLDGSTTAGLSAALGGPTDGPVASDVRVLAPVEGQEAWASGVTFERSREARNVEAGPVDFYDRVYDAVRPELFCKASPGRVRGPGEPVGLRVDSGWGVPGPGVGLAAAAAGPRVAIPVGNDMPTRSIEGETPLSPPQ